MRSDFRQDMHRDPAELEREADRARSDLEHTLQDLERVFSPGQILDQVLQMVKRNGGEFGRNLSTQVKNNPVPVLLTGIGVTWLAAASDRPPRQASTTGPSTGERMSSAASSAQGAAGSVADRTKAAARGARETMSSATESTRSAMGSMSGATRHTAQSMAEASRTGARSLADGYDYLRREQPLVLGALAVAVGAALGALLPSTAREDEWLGEHKERATERLKEEGRQKAEEAKTAAADAAQAARQAAEPKRAGPQGSSAGTGGTGTASASE